jgi:uncharacterized protein (TIGR03000 family)
MFHRRHAVLLFPVLLLAGLPLDGARNAVATDQGHGGGKGHEAAGFHGEGFRRGGPFRGDWHGAYPVGFHGRGGYYPWWYGYGYPGEYPFASVYIDPAYYGPGPYVIPVTGSPAGVNMPPPGAPGAAGAVPLRLTEADVLLSIRVPNEAIVRINGVQTIQTGPRREFLSSGLVPGRSYTFDVRAQWTGPDGKPVEYQRRISVQGGERRAVDFLMSSIPDQVVPAAAVTAP